MRSRLASDRVVYFEFILPGMFKLAPFEYTHIHTHTHRGGQLAGECIVTGMLKNKIIFIDHYHSWCFTSTEARLPIRDGDRVGRDDRVKARPRKPPEKDRRDRVVVCLCLHAYRFRDTFLVKLGESRL